MSTPRHGCSRFYLPRLRPPLLRTGWEVRSLGYPRARTTQQKGGPEAALSRSS